MIQGPYGGIPPSPGSFFSLRRKSGEEENDQGNKRGRKNGETLNRKGVFSTVSLQWYFIFLNHLPTVIGAPIYSFGT